MWHFLDNPVFIVFAFLTIQHAPGLIKSPAPLFAIVLITARVLQARTHLLEARGEAVDELLLFLVERQTWLLARWR